MMQATAFLPGNEAQDKMGETTFSEIARIRSQLKREGEGKQMKLHPSAEMSLQERARSKASREYKMIYFLTFPVFLIAALVLRFVPSHGPKASSNLLREARELASSSIPYAFMG